MTDKSQYTARDRAMSLVLAASAAATLWAGTSPPGRADDDDAPPPPPVAPLVTGDMVIPGTATVVQSPDASENKSCNVPSAACVSKPIELPSNVPKVQAVGSYTLQDCPGTFTHKIAFSKTNDAKETRVLAADSEGNALDPSRVRLAFLTTGNENWVFFPGTGKLERVEGWPKVYPAAQRRVAVHPLTDLFGDPAKGPKWLETARQIAVAIAAVVITAGAIVILGPAFLAGAAAVPLAW
ncbi:hypothetical protein [Mycobacterium branderi]|uniref:Uncharacterized protein n=1 Tax=Mycobacterium branderi TaxID=43348 RepID=A0A7I7W2C4_9MYCO|nr:hypothetical protein [Mycobacterium branderi]MCV7233780.1 hypothetical protein [Mycobacterium branderi]ORA39677.1 hypothetical protein BST20_09280 [Mycobacterium branderi]BBZ11744.1 hypothetical protein MBRA_19390 [Mycobacterium branderi]